MYQRVFKYIYIDYEGTIKMLSILVGEIISVVLSRIDYNNPAVIVKVVKDNGHGTGLCGIW